jgi:16S rRNA (guanine527-N7)-methyltransferase
MPAHTSAEALDSLVPWAQAQDVTIEDRQREQLEIYLENLLLWNRRLALVSQQNPVTIVDKHFADSIVAAKQCLGARAVVDLGSGAGFPGVIIAIQCPKTRVTLIESRRKKASFLLDTARMAGLANVEVIVDRIESIAGQPEHRAQYEVSIARALGSLAMLLEYSALLLDGTGLAIAMKGPSYASEMEATPIRQLGFGTPSVDSYLLPDKSQRALLHFSRLVPNAHCST